MTVSAAVIRFSKKVLKNRQNDLLSQEKKQTKSMNG